MPKKLNCAKRLDQGRDWLQNMEAEFRRDAEAALERWLAGKRVLEAVDDDEEEDEDPALRDAAEALEQLENLAHWRGAKAAIAIAEGDLADGWEEARRYWREIALVAKANARTHAEGEGPASFYFRMTVVDKALLGLLAVGERRDARWLSQHLLHLHQVIFHPRLAQEHAISTTAAFAIALELISRNDWDALLRLREAGAPLGPYAGVLDAWSEPEAMRRALATALDWHVQQTLDEREYDEGFYDIWPIEVQALVRVRRDLGLETPLPEHQLLASPLWAGGPPAALAPMSDRLFDAVASKLLPPDYDGDSLAMVEGRPIDFEIPEEDDEEFFDEEDDDEEDGVESFLQRTLRLAEERARERDRAIFGGGEDEAQEDDEEEAAEYEDEEDEDYDDDDEEDSDDEEGESFDEEEDEDDFEDEEDEDEEGEEVPVPQTIEEFEALLLKVAAQGEECDEDELNAVSDYAACFVVDWKDSSEAVIAHVEDRLPIGALDWEYLDDAESVARFERQGRVAEAVVGETEEEKAELEALLAELEDEGEEWEEDDDDAEDGEGEEGWEEEEDSDSDSEDEDEDEDEEEETEQPPPGRIYRALIGLRDALRPEYDIKAFYAWSGYWPDPERRIGADTQVFVLLPSAWWNRFAELHPEAMKQLFVSLDDAYTR